MKSTFTVLGLVFVLLAGAAAGYFLATNKPSAVPGVTPTPSVENMIVIDSPKSGSLAKSPLKVTGRARGNWYFEAGFPVELKDMNGQELAIAPAQALSEWMTTDWVPFEVTLVFSVTATTTENGTLTLHKDNPSGEPQNDDSRTIQVKLK